MSDTNMPKNRPAIKNTIDTKTVADFARGPGPVSKPATAGSGAGPAQPAWGPAEGRASATIGEPKGTAKP